MRNSRNNNSKWKRRLLSILKIAGIVMLCAIVSVGAVTLSGGLNKELNPDNLIVAGDYYENRLRESSNGLKVEWDNDGTFVISGKQVDDTVPDSKLYESPFTEITLDAGTYTLSCGNNRAALDKYGLYITIPGDIDNHYAADTSYTFTLTEKTTVIIGFFVRYNLRVVSAGFEPVLVDGKISGEFYK